MSAIARAVPADAARLAALHEKCFPHGWSERDIGALLRQPGVAGFACESGFVLIRRVVDEAEILTICVDPEARRAGLGAALLGAAMDEVSKLGAVQIFLDVSTRNTAAQTLYAHAGFTETGRRPGYYADGSDAILMVKPCDRSAPGG